MIVPSWDVHSKVYELLGLNSAIYKIIDNMVDREPPRVKDVLPYYILQLSAVSL